ERRAGLIVLGREWSVALPTSEHLELRFPSVLHVLDRVEQARPDVVHLATPGPVGLCGLAVAKLLGLPLVGSYHTELGPYALHLTRDLVIAEAMGAYVDWFYGRCDVVLAPTSALGSELRRRHPASRVAVWSRGVDATAFSPARRSAALRRELLGDGTLLLVAVGRVSPEKRLDVLLAGFELALASEPGLRLAVIGDGPARE